MNQLLEKIRIGVNVHDLCALGDQLLQQNCTAVYRKLKEHEKGIAFPTCISRNNIVSHFSPLPEDPVQTIQEGDLVKMCAACVKYLLNSSDMGAHIDGYIAQAAHTIITTSPIADVVCAAFFAAECAIRLARPGVTNTQITSAIKRVAELFHCQPVEGVLSHQMKRYVIDGNQVILNRAEADQQVEVFEFQPNQVYAFDIVMSTKEGKSREENNRTTVFKRAIDRNYQLKLQASRQLFSEIQKRFPKLPFTLRALDEKKRRLGIVELVKHDLLDSYPVLWERDGGLVAQFKFTVLIHPNTTVRMNAFPLPHVTSQYSVDSDPTIKEILALSTKRIKKKNKKPKSTDMMDTS